MLDIKVTKTTAPKAKPDEKHLASATITRTICSSWTTPRAVAGTRPRIEPYHSLELDPAALVFHYAQECFEGMKAYRAANGRVLLFRPEKNAARMQSTHRRLCIPGNPRGGFRTGCQGARQRGQRLGARRTGHQPLSAPVHHRHRGAFGREAQCKLSVHHHRFALRARITRRA